VGKLVTPILHNLLIRSKIRIVQASPQLSGTPARGTSGRRFSPAASRVVQISC
jgi:hypothetical protein